MYKNKIAITLELGTRLKDFRNQYKIKAKDIAEHIDKSAAYISKLEKGEIQQIEKKEFVRILDYITSGENGYDKFFEYISDMADEEYLEKSVFFLNFDWVERKLPLPSELVKYMNDKITKNDIDIVELVDYINRNDDLEANFFDEYKIDKNTVEGNVWYNYTELDVNSIRRSFIWVQLENETAKKILAGTAEKVNYLSVYVILYHIYKIEELKKKLVLDERTRSVIMKKTHTKLRSYKFYLLSEKRKMLYQAESEREVEGILSKFDYENRQLTTSLIKHLSMLADYDVKYTNQKLRGIINNIETTDVSFAMAYMAISLESLKELPSSVKRDFLKGVNELIEKCCNADSSEPEFEKY